MNRRAAAAAARLAVFALFAWYVYSTHYFPFRNEPYDEVLTTATIRAANAGLPFHLQFVSSDGVPQTPVKMSDYYGDYGIHILLSLTGSAGRWWYGPSYTLDSTVVRGIIAVFLVGAAAAMMMPGVPLAVGAAGVFSLWAQFRWATLGLYDARYWGVSFVVCVAMVYLGAVLKRWTIWRIVSLLVLAAIAAYGQLLRQEAGPTPTALGLVLVLAAVIAWLTSRRVMAGQMELRTLARRAAAGGVLLIAVNAAAFPAERWLFSRAWHTPYSQTSIAVHGSGWPLYLSLGYVSNPFNIGWRDPIGEIHARLINPAIVLNADPAFQRTLLEEFRRIVIARPWLLLQNMVAKAFRIHELASRPSGANTGTIITQSRPMVRVYWAVPFVLIALVGALLYRGTAEGVMVWCAGLALAAAASSGPLVVFPEYIGGLQGATIALVFILPAAVLSSIAASWPVDDAPAARGLFTAYVLAGTAVAMIAAAFVGVQALRYRTQLNAIASADPLESIRTRQFRYAHFFNDLPLAKQGRLIAQLQASTDPSVTHVVDERSGNLDLFAPQVVVRTDAEIHLFVWMGRGFIPPEPRLFQGSTHASLLICGDCPQSASINDLLKFPMRWTMINDLEWQGRYRMFSVQNMPTLQNVSFLRITAERTRALDTSLLTWMVPELISTARLSFAVSE